MLTLLLQGCWGREISGWELDCEGRWGCPMPWSTSAPALWWDGQQNTSSYSWTWDLVFLWHLLEIYTIILSESLKRPFVQTKKTPTYTLLNGPILWDNFSRLLAVSPLQFLLVYVHLISNQTKPDLININSATLLMTTKHWLRWLIHLVMLGGVCANKKCSKTPWCPNCGAFLLSWLYFRFTRLKWHDVCYIEGGHGASTILTSTPLHSHSFPLLSSICSQL